jgi:hypothetical protein
MFACTKWLDSHMMTQTGLPTPFGVLEIMPVQFMNKTIWFVHDDVYTSLQLLEIWCWCRGFASGGLLLALLLLASLKSWFNFW